MFFSKQKTEFHVIKADLQEPKQLPTGMTAFHEWSDRIIGIAGLSATIASQKHTLASMIMQLKPTIAFESDAFFVNSLLHAAASQVALEYAQKVYPEEKDRLLQEAIKAKQEEEKQNQAEVMPPSGEDAKILEIKRV